MLPGKAGEVWRASPAHPEWDDDGRGVVLVLGDGRVVFGVLCADDFFFAGEEDGPLFSVELFDGTDIAFRENRLWRFV